MILAQVETWPEYDLALVLCRRSQNIKALKRKRDRLVRRNRVLQAAQTQRQIEHLEGLNSRGRGRTRYALPSALNVGSAW
jgi:hypothetical protein